MTALDVACPLCGAGVGKPCRSQTGSGFRPKNGHKARQKKRDRLSSITFEYDEHGLPIINATAVLRGGHWMVEFACPWCGRTHTHGGGTGRWPDGDGSRASHCNDADAPSQYVIRVTEVSRP